MANNEMFVKNPLDPDYGRISYDFLPTGIAPPATPNLNQVLTAGNQTFGVDINSQGGNVLCDAVKCISIEPIAFPLTTDIAVGGNLVMIPTAELQFEDNAIIRNNQFGGAGSDVIIDSIPVAVAPLGNVVAYDTTTKKLYHQPAGGGATPDLSAVLTAGNTASADINMNGNDITGVASVQFTPTSKIDYASVNTKITVVSDNISIDAGGGGLIEMTNTGLTNITGTDVGINATTGSVSIQATGATNNVDIERIRFTNNSITTTNVEPLNIGCQNNQNMNITTTGTGDVSINAGRALNAIAQQGNITATGSLFLNSTGTGGTARISNSVGGNTRFDITATGNELRNPSTGGSTTILNSSTDPALILRTNSGLNQPVLLDMFMSRNTGAFPANGDVITEIRFKGDDYLGNEQEYAKIQTIAQNVGTAGQPTNVDGTLSFQCITNDVYNTYITLNGSSQQINMGKDVLMGGNSIQNVLRIGTNVGSSFGQTGQSLFSGGSGVGCFYSYNTPLTLNGNTASVSITTGTNTDILGNPFISLNTGYFVPSPTGKYEIEICGCFTGVNDGVELEISLWRSGIYYGGQTFTNGATNTFLVGNSTIGGGSYYTNYLIKDTVVVSPNLAVPDNIYFYLFARPSSGSHTVGNHSYNIKLTPVY
jgi:hypothetical protein